MLGVYQSWQIMGTVRVSSQPTAGVKATISGVYLDPVEKVSGGTQQ